MFYLVQRKEPKNPFFQANFQESKNIVSRECIDGCYVRQSTNEVLFIFLILACLELGC